MQGQKGRALPEVRYSQTGRLERLGVEPRREVEQALRARDQCLSSLRDTPSAIAHPGPHIPGHSELLGSDTSTDILDSSPGQFLSPL